MGADCDPDPASAEGALRSIRCAVPWDTFSLVDQDPRAVRVFFAQAGTRAGASSAITEIFVSESAEHVAVTLIERAIVGVYPSGAIAGQPLMRVSGCMELQLAAALGDRTLIDGATGERARRLRPDASERDADWTWARVEAEGCPRWMP
jgi:hypothetical protein